MGSDLRSARTNPLTLQWIWINIFLRYTKQKSHHFRCCCSVFNHIIWIKYGVTKPKICGLVSSNHKQKLVVCAQCCQFITLSTVSTNCILSCSLLLFHRHHHHHHHTEYIIQHLLLHSILAILYLWKVVFEFRSRVSFFFPLSRSLLHSVGQILLNFSNYRRNFLSQTKTNLFTFLCFVTGKYWFCSINPHT